MIVFISYRRADTQDLAGRIADRLRATPSVKEVFLDVTGVAPGANFVERIEAVLSRKPVCLVLLGRAWLGPRGAGDPPRIVDAGDVVRMEVSRMLAEGLRIVPVLAGDAAMPQANCLPDDIMALASLNALPIRHESFERDMLALSDALLGPGTSSAGRLSWVGRALRATLAVLLSAGALLVGAALHEGVTGRSLEETLGSRGAVWMLVAVVLVTGMIAGLATAPGRFR
jgi:hypothetical protein